MADQHGDAQSQNRVAPPTPIADFKKCSLPFPPPKPPVLHPNLDSKKKGNPFAPKVPKTRPEKPNENKVDMTKEAIDEPVVVKPSKSVPTEEELTVVQPVEIQKKLITPEIHRATEYIAEPVTAEQKVIPPQEPAKDEITSKTEVEEVKPQALEQRNDSQEEPKAEISLGGDRIDMSGGLMGWISKTMTESKILSDVANKARYGMEQVIITLDPGMKGFLARDGVVDLYMSVEDHAQIRAIQEGFEKVFANVLVRNIPTAKGNLPETVYGSSYSLDVCRTRAERIVQSRLIPADAVVLVFQPFIFHLDDRLYSSTRLLLKWKENEFNSMSQLLDVDQSLFDILKKRSAVEGMEANDFPINLSTAAQQVYGVKEESWTGPPPPYSFSELLIPAASLVALNFMNSSLHGSS